MDISDNKREPLNVFYYYDKNDQKEVSQIEKHCIPLEESGRIKIWHQGKIRPGQVFEREIRKQLNQAEVIIMMLSSDLLVSDWFSEIERISILRAQQKKSILIPVLLKPCLFTGYSFTEFKMIPADGKPVETSGMDLAERYNDVAIELHNITDTIEELTIENNTQTNILQKQPDDIINILYLINDPEHLKSELANEEINCIKHRLLIGKCSCKYELIAKNIKTLEDFQRAMLEFRPRIVHFSGYATNEEKLIFQDLEGEEIDIKPESLCKLFALFSDNLDIVLLNSCYSKLQADSISKALKYVIGVKGGVEKKLSIDFINGFYQAISFGTSIKKAFDLAINLLEMKNLKYAENIVMLEKEIVED